MSNVKFGDIEEAVMFVSYGMYGDHCAMLCKRTGEICWSSEASDMDEIPEEAYGSEDWIDIPHKNDLDLGRDLAFEFIAQHLPSEQERVQHIFRRRGAYSRYKDFLESKGMLQAWYDFENEQTKQAIIDWCQDNDITVTDIV